MYFPSIIVPFMDFEVKIYIVLSNVNPSIDPWNKIKYKASSILLNSNEDKQPCAQMMINYVHIIRNVDAIVKEMVDSNNQLCTSK